MSMLLVPLVLGAGAVGVYYLTRKNRGKKHSSRRHRSSRRSTRGGRSWHSMGPRPIGPSIGSNSIKPPGLKGGSWWSRAMQSIPRPMGPQPRPEPRPMAPGTNGSGTRPRDLMGGKKSRKHKKH